MRAILFDIDGTLLRCGPQVRPLFAGALREVYGSFGSLNGYDFAGKTDPRIVLDLIRATGFADDEILARLPAMRDAYLANLERGLERQGMCLLPGVVELLERLAGRGDVVVGLLTGNWRDGARIKLSRFGLGRFFAFGAFGDDGVDRRDLVPVALARAAEQAGCSIAPERALIVGDTERDVDCARASGVPSLAVATGFTDAGRLQSAGADWVYPDLEAAAPAFEAILA